MAKTKTKKGKKKSKAKVKIPKPDFVPGINQTIEVMAERDIKTYTVKVPLNKRCFIAKGKGCRVFDVFSWVRVQDGEPEWTWAILDRSNPTTFRPVQIT